MTVPFKMYVANSTTTSTENDLLMTLAFN